MSQIYGTDSFDRFGDDLCQHLLSYLSLEQRFKFECLSKQCQQFIYSTPTMFTTNPLNRKNIQFLNPIMFELLLKKCVNISFKIYFDVQFNANDLFGLIVKHCQRLHSINISMFWDLNVFTNTTTPKTDANKTDSIYLLIKEVSFANIRNNKTSNAGLVT